MLEKYTTDAWSEFGDAKRRYKLKTMPKFLWLHAKRFSKNDFFREKKPALIQFPLTNLPLNGQAYDLVANVVHVGSAKDGAYKVQVKHCEQWYQAQDLIITEVLPEQVAVSEAYLLLYRRV